METDDTVRIVSVDRASSNLYPGSSVLIKALLLETANSQQDLVKGEQDTPIDFEKAIMLMTSNPHHETCIRTKRDAIVGLGFLNEFDKQVGRMKKDPASDMKSLSNLDEHEPSKAEMVLDPLCDESFQSLINDVVEDYCNTGNGYIEVVRGQGETITGLWHCPAPSVRVFVEDSWVNRHFKVYTSSGEKRFARFGDRALFLSRNPNLGLKPETTSELIHFRNPSSRSKSYGMSDWLSAVPAIELLQMIHQQQFDFFLNRGVPEFMALFLGTQIPKDVWTKIEEAVRATIGQGNQHKTIALNIGDPNMKVQIEKLALEGKTDNSFKELTESLSMEVVTSHRVPPLLAGIQIPGKLGAVNELPNALLAFQTLYVDQAQKIVTNTLGTTLGNPEMAGGIGLERQDFVLRKITDKFDMQGLDTMSRMRETAVQAQQDQRNLADGVKKEESTPEEIGKALGRLLLAAQSAKVA